MNSKIMQDNFLYLQEWKKYNPTFQDTLFIEDDYLICKINDKVAKIDIHDFYLPEILYNELLRKSLMDNSLTSEDVFQIIRLYVETNQMNNYRRQRRKRNPNIAKIYIENGQPPFLVIVDELNSKYRYDTDNPQRVLEIYNLLKANKETVSLEDLGKELKK